MKPKTRLIVLFCRGEGERFTDRCQYYMPLSDECRLLKDRELRDIFDKGRCQPYERLKEAIKGKLRRYKDVIEPKEHSDRLTFEVAERAKQQPLKSGSTFKVLLGYLRKAAYSAVVGLLREEGVIMRKRCGYCWYLSLAEGCHRETLLVEGQEVGNPLYNQKRKLSDSACPGFDVQPHETMSPEIVSEIVPDEQTAPNLSSIHGTEIRDKLDQILRERIAHARTREKRLIAIRRHTVYCLLIKLIRDDDLSWKEAKETILSTRKKGKRTLERDLAAIREVLIVYYLRQLLEDGMSRERAIAQIADIMKQEPQEILKIVEKFEEVSNYKDYT